MNALESLLRTFVETHPEEAARALDGLGFEESVRLFKRLPIAVATPALERLSPHVAGPVLEQMTTDQVNTILKTLPPRSSSAILHQMQQARRDEALATLPTATARLLRDLLHYPADTAGGMMEPKVASLAIDLTAQQAISNLRKTPREALHYLYVTDRNGVLVGVLNMRDLLLASPREPIEPLVQRSLVSVPATLSQEEVVTLMRQRRFLALPVVDSEGKLIGVVKHDEALQAGQLAAFEDMQKIVGAGGDESALSPVSIVIKRRLPWLYVNLATAFAAAAVVGMFEGIIARVTALAVLLPVVSGQGGNSGGQSLAVIMRGLALRELLPGSAKRVFIKEAAAGLVNGIAVAIVTAAAVLMFWVGSMGAQRALGLALVIGLAMIVNMVAAAFAGAAIPLVLRAIGRDPAQSAGIFLTTVTDIVGFASFLGFATVFSKMLV